MNKWIYIFIIAVVLTGGALIAQCPSPAQAIIPEYEKGWVESAQSKAVQFNPGDEYEMNFIAQAGVKYRIQAAAGADDFLRENISFQLLVKEEAHFDKGGKVQNKISELILYDSGLADKDDEVIIITAKTQRLSIKVKVEGKNVPDAIPVCTFILIETKK